MTGRVAEMRKGPVWVNLRRTHIEQFESAVPRLADIDCAHEDFADGRAVAMLRNFLEPMCIAACKENFCDGDHSGTGWIALFNVSTRANCSRADRAKSG